MAFDHTDNFVRFWNFEFPGKQCPALPKKPEELNITAQMALSTWDSGKLWQNLFSNSSQGSQPLPADVALRLNKGELLPQDAPALRAANLEHFAQNCEQLAQRQQDQRLVDQATEGRKRYLEQKKQSEIWANSGFNERLAMAPPTPESIARARAEWGITGQAEWEK